MRVIWRSNKKTSAHERGRRPADASTVLMLISAFYRDRIAAADGRPARRTRRGARLPETGRSPCVPPRATARSAQTARRAHIRGTQSGRFQTARCREACSRSDLCLTGYRSPGEWSRARRRESCVGRVGRTGTVAERYWPVLEQPQSAGRADVKMPLPWSAPFQAR